jgi:HSP20 family molecular chaperone IbpA
MELYTPGVSKSDFHLNVEGDMLTVSFESKRQNKEENKKGRMVQAGVYVMSAGRPALPVFVFTATILFGLRII